MLMDYNDLLCDAMLLILNFILVFQGIICQYTFNGLSVT